MFEGSILLPSDVEEILKRFSQDGAKAYLVGGCVRDSLLGKIPQDWDICTEALPQQIKEIFADCPIIETGLIHGTVTVIFEQKPFEITTFRTEKEYHNHRKPSAVVFCKSIEQDLARRDFTINAMAYHPQEGVIDPYHGQIDLANKILRCVGVPCQRFSEDALRILRALRFACCMGFTIEPNTKQAILDCKKYLKEISGERIYTELKKMIVGEWVTSVFLEYDSILFEIIPKLQKMKNFYQNSINSIDDIWQDALYALQACPPIVPIRLAVLLHIFDFYKIDNKVPSDKSIIKGTEIVQEVLTALKLSKQEKEQVSLLIQWYNSPIFATKPSIKYCLNQIGVQNFFYLLQIKRADSMIKGFAYQQSLQEIADIEKIAKAILTNKECFSIQQLKLTGKDLIDLGIPQGKQIGKILNFLLQEVIEENLPNQRDSLQFAVFCYIKGASKRSILCPNFAHHFV